VTALAEIRGDVDALVALFVGFILFIIPSGDSDNKPLLTWDDTRGIAWNILLLFGGGLALSSSFQSSGLATRATEWLGNIGMDGAISSKIVLFGSVLFATELISNTALAATLIPILLKLESLNVLEPLTLALPSTIAVSLAFMTPIATPPNAIAYGMAKIPLFRMIASGFIMNLVCLFVLVWWFK
jgi:sodium-dependent dicarboxylate transporter 2/3/5